MKKTLKIVGGIFGVFFLAVIVILIVDISNDVEFLVIEENTQGNGYYVRVSTAATSEDDLRTIVEEVKKDRPTGIDATWLWIHEGKESTDKSLGKLLASARIPYNRKGQIMVGADNSDYIFEMKK